MNDISADSPLLFYENALPNGELWVQYYRLKTGYLINFPSLAQFWISPNGLITKTSPAPGISRQTVEHLRLNQVLPLALSRQLKLVLHGACVELEKDAIAFLGVTGRGKSTLATSFARNGYRFLSDDGLQIEELAGNYLAKPNHPSVRLWSDSRLALLPPTAETAEAVDYTPKSRLLAGDIIPHCSEAKPLKAIYLLGNEVVDKPVVYPVKARNAIIELVRHSFLLDIDEKSMLKHHFGQLLDIVRTVPLFDLNYPREYKRLGEVREFITGHSKSLT